MNVQDIAASLWDFWISVRAAAKMMSPKVTVDSPQLDAGQFERILRQADLWLTPRAVDGFERADIQFLSEDERNKLTGCVEQFISVAAQVPPKEAASNQQVGEARPNFQGILEVLRPDKYGDPESLVIGKILEQQLQDQFPNWVRGLRIDTGEDANGDPAIWIWVEASDEATKKEVISRNFRIIQEQLEACLRRIGVTRWPYIRLRSVSELQN